MREIEEDAGERRVGLKDARDERATAAADIDDASEGGEVVESNPLLDADWNALRRSCLLSSSTPIGREYPTTSAARIAARRRVAISRRETRLGGGQRKLSCRRGP